MEIRVLVERTLAGCATHLLETAGIREQLLVRGHRLVRATDNQQLATRLEPALDALVRVRNDGSAGHRQLERTRRRRSGHGRMRPPRDVEVDACGGDRVR